MYQKTIWEGYIIPETLRVPSTSRIGVYYTLTIDENNKNEPVRCSCPGFAGHGYCKHTAIYKKITAQILYGTEFKIKVITSFNRCYDFVIDICSTFPECIGEYDQLDKISESVLLSLDKHYKTEMIHRAYRLAVADGEIVEPERVQVRKEKVEQVMHEIPRWGGNNVIDFGNGQTSLIEEESV